LSRKTTRRLTHSSVKKIPHDILRASSLAAHKQWSRSQRRRSGGGERRIKLYPGRIIASDGGFSRVEIHVDDLAIRALRMVDQEADSLRTEQEIE
jgi:hypothetical protein